MLQVSERKKQPGVLVQKKDPIPLVNPVTRQASTIDQVAPTCLTIDLPLYKSY